LIGIADQQADGRTGGFSFKDTGEDLDFVGFTALRGMPGFSGFAPIQIALQVRLAEFQSRGATIDHATQCRSMTFTETGYRENFSKAVS
jgi:hypothetical protein